MLKSFVDKGFKRLPGRRLYETEQFLCGGGRVWSLRFGFEVWGWFIGLLVYLAIGLFGYWWICLCPEHFASELSQFTIDNSQWFTIDNSQLKRRASSFVYWLIGLLVYWSIRSFLCVCAPELSQFSIDNSPIHNYIRTLTLSSWRKYYYQLQSYFAVIRLARFNCRSRARPLHWLKTLGLEKLHLYTHVPRSGGGHYLLITATWRRSAKCGARARMQPPG